MPAPAQNAQPSLRQLLAPQTIAVIGATEKTGPGRNVIRCLQDIGFEGKIYPLNPKYETLFGLPCYGSLEELPESVDLAVIAIPAAHVNEALRRCGEAGCRAVTVLSSGFGETGPEGALLQQEMVEIAKQYQMHICGPNCLGHMNFCDKTGAYSSSLMPDGRKGQIAAVSQSGSMAISMYQAFRRLGMSHVISYGNQAVTTLSDYLNYLADDPNTKVITTFIEGLNDGPAFRAACAKCRRQGKAIVALKIGKSATSQKIALAHTAAMVGSKQVYHEVFRECGILEVADVDEMIQTVTVLLQAAPIQVSGRKLAITAISGGQCGIIGDIAEEIGLQLADFSQRTKERISAIVPAYVTARNPLDVALLGDRDYTEYRDVLRCLAEDDDIGVIAVMQDAPQGVGQSTVQHYHNIARAALEVAETCKKPIITFTNHSTPYDLRIVQELLDNGQPLLQGTRESLFAIKHLLDYYSPLPEQQPDDMSGFDGLDWPGIGQAIKQAKKAGAILGEIEGKALLRLLDMPVSNDLLCRNEEELQAALPAMGGKVALKIVSADIPHKTDAGGVALNLQGEAEILSAYRHMLATVRAKKPEAHISGVTLQEMAEEGVDLIIGMNKDAQFGPTIVFGLGGIYVELFRESSLRLLPLSRAEARRMIEESRSYRLLGEVRGRPALDIELLVDILLKLSLLMEHFGDEIREIDLNPIRIGVWGVKVLDALLVLEE